MLLFLNRKNHLKKIITYSIVITLLSFGLYTQQISSDKVRNDYQGIIWETTIYLDDDTTKGFDTVVMGEATDALDGMIDSYDVIKTPAPKRI